MSKKDLYCVKCKLKFSSKKHYLKHVNGGHKHLFGVVKSRGEDLGKKSNPLVLDGEGSKPTLPNPFTKLSGVFRKVIGF